MKKIRKAIIGGLAAVVSFVTCEESGINPRLHIWYEHERTAIAQYTHKTHEGIYRFFHDDPEEASQHLLSTLTHYQHQTESIQPVVESLSEKLRTFETEEQKRNNLRGMLDASPEYRDHLLDNAIKERMKTGGSSYLGDLYEELSPEEKEQFVGYALSLLKNKDAFIIKSVDDLSPDGRKTLVFTVNEYYLKDLKDEGRQFLRDTIKELMKE